MQRIVEELTKVRELLRLHPRGMSITDIAGKLGKNKHSVGRYLDILHASGHVDLRTFGMAKVYTLSSRVPLSALLSYTTDLVLVVDSGLRVLQANDPFLTLTTLDRDMIILQEIQFIPAPDPTVLEFLAIVAEQIIQQQDLDEIELQSEPKRYFHLRIVPTVFDDGTSGTTAILEDITSERAALNEIRESREFFRDIIANITDGIVVTEGNDILFINDRLIEITGYSREEIATMDPISLAQPCDQRKVQDCYQARDENPDSLHDIRFWAVRKDGDSRYLNIRMSAVHYGDKIRHYVLVSDMTERRRREEQENLQGAIMRCVVDQFPHPIYCYRDDGRFFMVNDAFSQLFGFPSEKEVAGKRLQDIISPDLLSSFTCGDIEIREKGGHTIQQVQFPGPDGTVVRYPVEKSAVSVGEGGGGYIFGVILTNCIGI